MSDLPEAEPIVLEEGKEGVKRSATPLSATGLRHWQTVLSMLNDDSHLTEAVTSTPPHSPQEPKTTLTPLQTTYHGNFNPTEKKLILTPLHPPPHPREIKKWINEKIAAKQRKSESKKSAENESLLEGQTHQDSNQPVNVRSCDYHMTCSFRFLLHTGNFNPCVTEKRHVPAGRTDASEPMWIQNQPISSCHVIRHTRGTVYLVM